MTDSVAVEFMNCRDDVNNDFQHWCNISIIIIYDYYYYYYFIIL